MNTTMTGVGRSIVLVAVTMTLGSPALVFCLLYTSDAADE